MSTTDGGDGGPRRHRGPEPECDDVTLGKIVAALELGHTREAACGAARVASRTLRKWIALDAGGSERHAGIGAMVEDAMEIGEHKLASDVIRLGESANDWRAAMTFLERTRPSTYAHADMIARRDKLRAETEAIKRATSNDGTAGEMLVVELPPETPNDEPPR